MSLYLKDKKFTSMKMNDKVYTAAWLAGVKYPLRSNLQYQWATDYVVPEAKWLPFNSGKYTFPQPPDGAGELFLCIRSTSSPMVKTVIHGDDLTYQWAFYAQNPAKQEGSLLPFARMPEFSPTFDTTPLIATLADGSVVEVDFKSNQNGNPSGWYLAVTIV